VSCARRTAYYERRQRLAPITGPAPKPRVQNGAKKKDPFFPFPVNFPFPRTRNDFGWPRTGLYEGVLRMHCLMVV
jgi:hypothetical protein